MLTLSRFHGGTTKTEGCCPGCGADVPRRHAWNTIDARDVYDCPRCGTFEYAIDGTQLPSRPPMELGTLLGTVDVIS